MQNPLVTNTTTGTLSQFGYVSLFDLYKNKLIIDITGNTIGAFSNITWEVKDPYGSELNTNSPIITGETSIEIPLNIGDIKFGLYTIKGIATDTDNKVYEIEETKEICKPKDFENEKSKGTFSHNADCSNARMTLSDNTVYGYQGKKPSEYKKEYAIRTPNEEIDSIKGIVSTPIVLTNIYSGDYLAKGYTEATYNLTETIKVKVRYEVRYSFYVTCKDRICEVLCCLNKLQDDTENCKSKAEKEALEKTRDRVYPLFMKALALGKCSQKNDKEIDEIKKILDCECGDCTTDNFEATPTVVTSDKDFVFGDCFKVDYVDGIPHINCKNNSYDIKKLENDCKSALIINKKEFNGVTTFEIGINADELSSCIEKNAEEIGFDINNKTLSIDTKCLDVQSTKDFKSILCTNDNNTNKFTGVRINGFLYVPNIAISLQAHTQIQSYLNSLSLGAFVVTPKYSNECNGGYQVEVVSLGNPNTLNYIETIDSTDTLGVSVQNAFSSAFKVSIKEWAQAMTDKICNGCVEDLKTCEEYTICTIKCEKKYTIVAGSLDNLFVYINNNTIPIRASELNGYRVITNNTIGGDSEFAIGCNSCIDSLVFIENDLETPVTSIDNGSKTINLKEILPIGTSVGALLKILFENDCNMSNILTKLIKVENTPTITQNWNPLTYTLSSDVNIANVLTQIKNDPILLSLFCSIDCGGVVDPTYILIDSSSYNTYTPCTICGDLRNRTVYIDNNKIYESTCDISGAVVSSSQDSFDYNVIAGSTINLKFCGFTKEECPADPIVILGDGTLSISFYDSSNTLISMSNMNISPSAVAPYCVSANIIVPINTADIQFIIN